GKRGVVAVSVEGTPSGVQGNGPSASVSGQQLQRSAVEGQGGVVQASHQFAAIDRGGAGEQVGVVQRQRTGPGLGQPAGAGNRRGERDIVAIGVESAA